MSITQSQSTMPKLTPRARRSKRRPPPFVVDEQPRFDPFAPQREAQREARQGDGRSESRGINLPVHLFCLAALAGLAFIDAPWWGYLILGIGWSWASGRE